MNDGEQIAAEYVVNGIPVQVSDRAYADRTERELGNIRENARRIAWTLYLKAAGEGRSRKGKEA